MWPVISFVFVCWQINISWVGDQLAWTWTLVVWVVKLRKCWVVEDRKIWKSRSMVYHTVKLRVVVWTLWRRGGKTGGRVGVLILSNWWQGRVGWGGVAECRLCQSGAAIGRFCNHRGDTLLAAWYRTQYFYFVKLICPGISAVQCPEDVYFVSQITLFTVCFGGDIVTITINLSNLDDIWLRC